MVTFEGKTFASWQEARASIVAKPEAAPVQAVAVMDAPPEAPPLTLDAAPVHKARSLVERYRPRKLAELAGQPAVVASLRAFVAKPYSRAWLLTGQSGIGKTAAAWALAGELGCDLDEEEMGGVVTLPAGEQSAESVRACADSMWLRPMMGSGWKVIIVNEVDGMSDKVENIWLDVIGEGRLPGKCVIIFSTNFPEKLSDRFMDRCGVTLQFNSTADDLTQAAKALAERIWRAERPGIEPDAAALAAVVSAAIRRGHVSFRRVVNGMAELLGE